VGILQLYDQELACKPNVCTRIRKPSSRGGHAMSQAVSRQPVTAEAQVFARISPCDICGGQSDPGTGFLYDFFGFSPSLLVHRASPYSYITCGMKNMPVGGRSSETWPHPIDKNNKSRGGIRCS
jgi:hypothetical protein